MSLDAARLCASVPVGDDRPLRVGMLVGSFGETGGGVAACVRDMAQALKRQPGLDVSVFASVDAARSGAGGAWGSVGLKLFPIVGPSSFGYARGLDRALEAADLDVLHVHGLWMYISVAARRWAARTGRPHIVSPHGMLDGWALKNSGWKKTVALRAYERSHLESAACVHALCEPERSAIRDFGLTNPVCVIPNGVDLPAKVARLRATPRRTLLFLGRVTPKKGLAALIEAWADAKQLPGSEPWDLEIAGSGSPDFLAELNALIERREVQTSVRFVGHKAGREKDATFVAADAFILPSVSEGQPLAVLEAWAHGLPTLITPQCNLPEGVAAGAASSISEDRAGIAAGLGSLFAMSDAERGAMGRKALQLAENEFSWASAASRWAQVYRWAASGTSRPASVSAA